VFDLGAAIKVHDPELEGYEDDDDDVEHIQLGDKVRQGF
jgi:hypothetical protein